MRINKQRGVSLIELMCVMGIATALMVGAISVVNETVNPKKLSVSDKITAMPLSSLEACLEVNGQFKDGKQTRYETFNRDCHYIWSEASKHVTEDVAKHSSMIGVTVFYGGRNEMYFPILQNNAGTLYYPGGTEAALETKILSKKQVALFNKSLDSIYK